MSGDICDISDCHNLGGSGAITIELIETMDGTKSIYLSMCRTVDHRNLAENAINIEGEKT